MIFLKIELDWIQIFHFRKLSFFLNFMNLENLQNSLPSHIIVCLSIDDITLGILEFFINMRIEPFRVVKTAPKLCFIKSKASQSDIKLPVSNSPIRRNLPWSKSRDFWAKRVGAIAFFIYFWDAYGFSENIILTHTCYDFSGIHPYFFQFHKITISQLCLSWAFCSFSLAHRANASSISVTLAKCAVLGIPKKS